MSENAHACGQEAVECRSFESCKSAVQVFSSPRFERLEALLNALEERIKLQFFLTAEAYQLRNVQIDKRMDTMNEFRGALTDRESSFFTRPEHVLYEKSVDADLRMLRETKADGKTVESDLRILREAKAEMQGKASQSNLNVTFTIALIGDAIALAALLFTFFKH